MKFRLFLTAGFATLAMSLMAQTHAEGEEYYKADQIENAKTLLERNLNNPGTDKAVSYYYMGQIAMEENKMSEAAKYFELGAQANPAYPYNFVGLAYVSLKSGDKQLAEKNFKEAESKGKKDAGVQVAIARAYYDTDPVLYQKEIDKRIEKARKINREHPDSYIFEGDMLRDQKDWGRAGSMYEMAVNFDNNATGAYVKYANLFTQVNPGYAINMLNKLLQANPTSALGQRELANAYYNKGDYANAATQYGKYVKNPNHFKEDEDRYAFLLFYDNKYQEGYDYATNLLASNPKNFSAMRYQFMNACQPGTKAGDLLDMATKLYAAHKVDTKNNKFAPIDYLLIADEFSKDKQADKAIEVLQEAIATIPENGAFDKQLASVYIDNNQYDKAADTYENYVNKQKEPGYNEYAQESLYSYFAAASKIKDDAETAKKYIAKSADYADKALKASPSQYKPLKILGDLEVLKATLNNAPQATLESAAKDQYDNAITLMEANWNDRFASDAKTMYNYLGNYNLGQKNNAKAKEYFNKYLKLDPNNVDYRKFVDGIK